MSTDGTEQEGKEVRKVPNRDKVTVGKPKKIVTSGSGFRKVAFPTVGGSIGGSGGNFYSPELSTDFLELPQSLDEQRNYYRFFYRADPFVGQAIDLHTELPLSKIRLGLPKAKDRELAKKAMDFCADWSKKNGLLHRLIEIVHEYYLIGEVFVFVEDTSPDMPQEIRYEAVRVLDEDEGEVIEDWKEREDGADRAVKWLKENYQGWTAVRILPPEQVHMESFPFTDERIVELIPDSKTKGIIEAAASGDGNAQRIVDSMPNDVVSSIRSGENISLNSDPEAGSFVAYLSRKKSQYEARGHSILERCIRTLVYRDKLRQAQTSIASRHMTPIRVVSVEDGDQQDVEELRDQVDQALMDPDYSIIANFEVRWEEMGADQRLLDLSAEYDLTDRQLYAGLGVTESLLSGESSYSGDRINLEVINTRYMLLREVLQDFVEEKIFKPMCARMGFLEEDDYGIEQVICPKLSFTRLALRDNQDTFDALFNLYQKGSLDIDIILELLNIDPETTKDKLERDLFTLNDATFNEVLRGTYSEVGRSLAENTNVAELIAEKLGLEYNAPSEDEDRF
jgi:hypothetical protein